MRSAGRIALFSLLLGMLTYGGVYLWKKQEIDRHHAHETAFDWFCDEFEVSGERREKIETLHAAYFPECEDHCVHYADTRETLAEINADPALDLSPKHVEAARRLAELEREADKRFIDFVYGVAAELEPGVSEIYLRRMKSWLDQSKSLALD